MTIPAGFNQIDADSAESYSGIALPNRGAPAPSAQSAAAGATPSTRDGYNQPSKPTVRPDGVGNTQAGRRFTDTFFDVHRSHRFPRGRPWTGEREFAANPDRGEQPGFVTSDLMQGEYVTDDGGNVDRAATFASVWTAPWIPLPKYFHFNYKRKLISFDYARGLQDEQRAFDRYYEAAALLGAGLNIAVEYGRVPKFQITAKLGFPTRLIPIYRAALANDPWLLGHRDEPNVELAKQLGMGQFGLRQVSFVPETQPLVTPEQVLATAPDGMKALLERLDAMQAELESLRAEKAKAQASAKRSHHKAKPAPHAPQVPNVPSAGSTAA